MEKIDANLRKSLSEFNKKNFGKSCAWDEVYIK